MIEKMLHMYSWSTTFTEFKNTNEVKEGLIRVVKLRKYNYYRKQSLGGM